MLTVGLTGGVGSGKSTVAAMLAARGAAVLDADEVVAALYRPGGRAVGAVRGLFGTAVIAADGGIDRAALGRRVLDDPEARRRLEAAVHPLVRDEIRRWLAGLETGGTPPPVAVVEAALLVETGSWRDFDALVVVSAALEVRRARAVAAGWNPERFDRTVAAQLSDAERETVATRVVRNDGGRGRLEAEVDALWGELAARASGTPAPRGR